MAKTVSIPLDPPIQGPSGPIASIVLREPCFDDYMELGEPYSVGESDESVRFAVERPDVIKAYVRACLVSPTDVNLLSQASARTARKVRNTVLGFIREADEASEASPTSPTASPSTPGSASIPVASAG